MTVGAPTGPRLMRIAPRFLAGFLALLIVGPLAVLLLTSFAEPGVLFFEKLTFTIRNYTDVIARPGTGRLVWNTLVYATFSMLLGVALAIVMAWLTERTDMPGRMLIRILMFSWMAVPPLVFAYGWVLLVNPGNGALNVMLRELFGLKGQLLSPYSMTSLVVISALSLVPTSYVMLSGLLRNMDPSLEDAGFVMGASRARVIRSITLPVLTPGLLSVMIFLYVGMVQTFDFPLVLGANSGIQVLSTRIFLLAAPDMGRPNYGLAGAFGVFLLLLAMLLMWGYFRATRVSERFRVISGRGFRPKRHPLGAWRPAAVAFFAFYFMLMLLPILILLWASLLPFYRVPNLADFGNLTLAAYAKVFSQPTFVRAIVNTVLLVAISSVLVIGFSCIISWFSLRARSASGKALDMLAFAPIAIPPVVMAIAMLLFFMISPIYGTIWVIIIGHVTIFIAFGTRTMSGAFIQIHRELEDAATISGAGWLSMFRRVVLPLVWVHVVNAWLWVVAHSARDLTFPLILLTSSNVVVASSIFVTWAYPDLPAASALSILMVGSLMLLVIPVQIFAFRRQGDD